MPKQHHWLPLFILLSGCSSTLDHSLFSFTAPPRFDGPISLSQEPEVDVHFFLRMRGDRVSRLSLGPVYVAPERADYLSRQIESVQCAGAALEGALRGNEALTKDELQAISAGKIPGTVIYYTKMHDGTTYSALMTCLVLEQFAVTIAFQEPSGVQPSDIPAVLRAIESMTFK